MKTKFCQYVSAIALLGAATVAQAEDSAVSANIAAASNYLFRGITQTDDGAAVSGGLDYDFGNGFSLGTWLSNIDFGGKESAEVDIYGGYGSTYKEVDWGVGAIYYYYPGAGGDKQGGDLDYAEVNGSLTWKRSSPPTGVKASAVATPGIPVRSASADSNLAEPKIFVRSFLLS